MESYLHKFAKTLLTKWLKKQYLRVDIEKKFYLNNNILFIPDITCYNEDGLNCFYEVYNKSELTGVKLANIQYYCYIHNIKVPVYELSANYILRQIKEPNKIKAIKLT